jgi:hypothetical protein
MCDHHGSGVVQRRYFVADRLIMGAWISGAREPVVDQGWPAMIALGSCHGRGEGTSLMRGCGVREARGLIFGDEVPDSKPGVDTRYAAGRPPSRLRAIDRRGDP